MVSLSPSQWYNVPILDRALGTQKGPAQCQRPTSFSSKATAWMAARWAAWDTPPPTPPTWTAWQSKGCCSGRLTAIRRSAAPRGPACGAGSTCTRPKRGTTIRDLVPTIPRGAHHLERAGYRTSTVGKTDYVSGPPLAGRAGHGVDRRRPTSRCRAGSPGRRRSSSQTGSAIHRDWNTTDACLQWLDEHGQDGEDALYALLRAQPAAPALSHHSNPGWTASTLPL